MQLYVYMYMNNTLLDINFPFHNLHLAEIRENNSMFAHVSWLYIASECFL
jgi:hypothetical protein